MMLIPDHQATEKIFLVTLESRAWPGQFSYWGEPVHASDQLAPLGTDVLLNLVEHGPGVVANTNPFVPV